MKEKLNKLLPYLVAIVLFIGISIAYFSPVLQGKKLYQNDIKHFTGMAKEVNDFRKEYDAEPYWTNSAFGGMPTYNLSALYDYDVIRKIDKVLRFLPRPADYLFLYLIGFFVLLLVLKVDLKLAFLGALAFGFSTYYIIILGVGHNAKAHAIAYMPLVLSGILLVLKKRYLFGFVITSFAMALEIYASHPQMTYYLLFMVLVLGVVYLLDAYKNKALPHFFKSMIILVVAVVLAVGANGGRLMATKEYVDNSTRGKSELTINADGSTKTMSSGLSKDYITTYSYGLLETFNLFIPRFMGGSNGENVGQDSNIYNFLDGKTDPVQVREWSEHAPLYWGKQPIVEGPAYIGAVILFLFVLGLYIVKGKEKKWLIGAVILSILLSWGKNFNILTDFFIDYVPLYNKFRAVSSIQVLTELAVPILGILALKTYFSDTFTVKEKLHYLKKTFIILGGIAMVFMLFGGMLLSFEGLRDARYDQMVPGLLDAIRADRKSVLFDDSLRSLLFVSSTALVLWLFTKNKISKNLVLAGIGLLLMLDLLVVDKKYVDNDDFLSASRIEKPFIQSEIDKMILQDESYYRVANFLVDPVNDGSTSYFHKSIGGYHAAKLGTYQDLYDFHISKNNIEVLNMLNTKYFMFPDENQRPAAQINPDANGNAWFVQDVKLVNNSNEEIKALDSLQTKKEAVINKQRLNSELKMHYDVDSTATIALNSYKPNELSYDFYSKSVQFVVFSEMYYKQGWKAYIDGEVVPYYRVNYALRGMEIPPGKHAITFKFEPSVIKNGNKATLISLVFLFIIPIGWFFIDKKRKND